jgi:hypothetical protein
VGVRFRTDGEIRPALITQSAIFGKPAFPSCWIGRIAIERETIDAAVSSSRQLAASTADRRISP